MIAATPVRSRSTTPGDTAELIRQILHAAATLPRTVLLRRCRAAADLEDPLLIATLEQLCAVRDVAVGANGTLAATPLRLVPHGDDALLLGTAPDRWLQRHAPALANASGAPRTLADTPRTRAAILEHHGAIVPIERWIGLDTLPDAPDWLAGLHARAARLGPSSGAVVPPDLAPRRYVPPARWIAEPGDGLLRWQEPQGLRYGLCLQQRLLSITSDEARRTRIALDHAAGHPPAATLKAAPDGTLLSLSFWLPGAEWRLIRVSALRTDHQGSRLRAIIPQGRLPPILSALQRLGVQLP